MQTTGNASAPANPHVLVPFLNKEVRTGGHRRLLELCEDLARDGFGVTVILNEELDYSPKRFTEIRLRCEYRHGKTLSLSFLFRRCVRRFFADNANYLKRPATAIMVYGETHIRTGRWLKRFLGVPLLYAHRSNTVREGLLMMREPLGPWEKAKAFVDLCRNAVNERVVTRRADAIVFQSPFDRADFVGRNPKAEKKARIIHGNIGAPRFKPEHQGINTSTRCRKLLFIGNLGHRKGIRYLLEAVDAVVKSGHDGVTLDVIGPSDHRDAIQSWIESRGLGKNITLHGRVQNPFPFLRSCDLLVVPSVFDSYTDTALEGLHVGIPVIGSDTGGIPDVLGSPELLFPVQDTEALADKIRRIVESDEYYVSLRALCESRVDAFHFDWPAEWAAILEKMGREDGPQGSR